MLYKFYKEVAQAYSCYIDANSLEEAKQQVEEGNCEWDYDDDGDTFDTYTAIIECKIEDDEIVEGEVIESWRP